MCSSRASSPSFSTFVIDTVFTTCPTVAWQWLLFKREVTVTTVSEWTLLIITLRILRTVRGGIGRGYVRILTYVSIRVFGTHDYIGYYTAKVNALHDLSSLNKL